MSLLVDLSSDQRSIVVDCYDRRKRSTLPRCGELPAKLPSGIDLLDAGMSLRGGFPAQHGPCDGVIEAGCDDGVACATASNARSRTGRKRRRRACACTTLFCGRNASAS